MVSHRRKINCILSANCLLSSILFLYILLLCSCRADCYATDTLKHGERITDDGETTLISSGGRFELGFFTPINSSSHKRFVGIWYKQDQQTVVWVANTESPVHNGSTGTFGIAEDGSLKISDTTVKDYWFKSFGPSSTNRNVKLMDSGNLVFSDYNDQSVTSEWGSFQDPTGTFLPGMNIDEFVSMTSWKRDGDPRSAQFTFRRDQAEGSYVISKEQGVDYWRSSWIQGSSDEMPDYILNLLSNLSSSGNFSYERLVMNYTGELQYWKWNVNKRNWSLLWKKPEDKYCSIYNFCGNFGSCNINNSPLVCKCLPGFHPTNPGNWNSREFSDGCTRNSTSLDSSNTFLSLKTMKVSKPAYSSTSSFYESECRMECLNNSQCQAYSFDDYPCRIWTWYVSNLQEEYTNGFNLSVRVAKSVIESTPRNCEPCGTNLILYPLSTRPNCGDSMYFSFYCNNSTGQVSFKTLNDIYRVASIDPDTRKFVIQVKHPGNDTNSTRIQQLNKSFPFNATIDSSNYSFEVKDEIEISWEPPLEPSCNSSRRL